MYEIICSECDYTKKSVLTQLILIDFLSENKNNISNKLKCQLFLSSNKPKKKNISLVCFDLRWLSRLFSREINIHKDRLILLKIT